MLHSLNLLPEWVEPMLIDHECSVIPLGDKFSSGQQSWQMCLDTSSIFFGQTCCNLEILSCMARGLGVELMA